MKYTIIIIGATAVGCTTPISHTNTPLATYDRDTDYGVEDQPRRFAVTVYYSRYQFIPDSGATATACKAALTSIAWEVAEREGRAIEPINEQRIRILDGRNIVTGGTSCEAFAVARWK